MIPPELLHLTLDPVTLIGGGSTTAEVDLSGPAPYPGVTISLSSDNDPLVTIPASITIPAGASSARFPMTTQAVTTDTYVTLSTAYGGRTRMATLILSPSAPPGTQ